MKKNNRQSSNPNITPVVVYENAGTFLQKKEILNENKGKAGVYRFLLKQQNKWKILYWIWNRFKNKILCLLQY